MRKIEEQIIATIREQQQKFNIFKVASNGPDYKGATTSKTLGNTTVRTTVREDMQIVTSVYLHGNLIAQNGVMGWGFKMCGWPTTTTKSRVNALASAFGHAGVYTKKGKHYSGDREVNALDWF